MTVIDIGANVGALPSSSQKPSGLRTGIRVRAATDAVPDPMRQSRANLFDNVTGSSRTGSRVGSIVVPAIDYARGGNYGGVALAKAVEKTCRCGHLIRLSLRL